MIRKTASSRFHNAELICQGKETNRDLKENPLDIPGRAHLTNVAPGSAVLSAADWDLRALAQAANFAIFIQPHTGGLQLPALRPLDSKKGLRQQPDLAGLGPATIIAALAVTTIRGWRGS